MFVEYEEGDNKVVDNIIYCDYKDCRFLSVREIITIIEKIVKYKANVVSIDKKNSICYDLKWEVTYWRRW